MVVSMGPSDCCEVWGLQLWSSPESLVYLCWKPGSLDEGCLGSLLFRISSWLRFKRTSTSFVISTSGYLFLFAYLLFFLFKPILLPVHNLSPSAAIVVVVWGKNRLSLNMLVKFPEMFSNQWKNKWIKYYNQITSKGKFFSCLYKKECRKLCF